MVMFFGGSRLETSVASEGGRKINFEKKGYSIVLYSRLLSFSLESIRSFSLIPMDSLHEAAPCARASPKINQSDVIDAINAARSVWLSCFCNGYERVYVSYHLGMQQRRSQSICFQTGNGWKLF